MKTVYQPPNDDLWQGRTSENQLYLHEKVRLVNVADDDLLDVGNKCMGVLGYGCDEGVRRNHGRVGSKDGPDAIRSVFARLPNHLPQDYELIDFGNIVCAKEDMEAAQEALSQHIQRLREQDIFCLVLGGGHDMAYGHYKGLKGHLGENSVLGIINFDAHFDLRSNEKHNNSGTPFYQIGMECKKEDIPYHYLCLGIREDANDSALYNTASVLGVNYLEIERFHINQLELVKREIENFLSKVTAVYVTIDLDGFSSAYAPGVSASSPIGFAPDIVIESLKTIIHSKKLIGMDIAEMNPQYDRDQQTAKLAAGLMHFVMHLISLF